MISEYDEQYGGGYGGGRIVVNDVSKTKAGGAGARNQSSELKKKFII